ncbi:MAG: ABC transporter permease [Spirochaeta sp.]
MNTFSSVSLFSISSCLAVARKEIRSSFNTPVAYIVLIVFLVFSSGWLFLIEGFFSRDVASLRLYFGTMPLILSVIVPALTMRVWAEEKRLGTYELLVSLPLRESELVLGKYLGTLAVLGTGVLLTIPLPLSVMPFGSFDPGQIIGEYLGLCLFGMVAAAVGCLSGSLARNQISAFLLGVLILLSLTFVGSVTAFLQLPAPLHAVLRYLSLDFHFSSMIKGVIDTRALVYFIVLVTAALFLNIKILVLQKWR